MKCVKCTDCSKNTYLHYIKCSCIFRLHPNLQLLFKSRKLSVKMTVESKVVNTHSHKYYSIKPKAP